MTAGWGRATGAICHRHPTYPPTRHPAPRLPLAGGAALFWTASGDPLRDERRRNARVRPDCPPPGGVTPLRHRPPFVATPVGHCATAWLQSNHGECLVPRLAPHQPFLTTPSTARQRAMHTTVSDSVIPSHWSARCWPHARYPAAGCPPKGGPPARHRPELPP